MALLDTLDGALMTFAYDWALAQPVRKLFYNLTVTGLSVAVALGIGTVELLSVAVERLGLRGGLWDAVAGGRPRDRRLRRGRAVRRHLGGRDPGLAAGEDRAALGAADGPLMRHR